MDSNPKTKLENLFKHKFPFECIKDLKWHENYYSETYETINKIKTKVSLKDVINNILPFLKYLQSVNNKKEGLTFVKSEYDLILNLPSSYSEQCISFEYDGTNFTLIDFLYEEDFKKKFTRYFF